jgi:hypothetical protein
MPLRYFHRPPKSSEPAPGRVGNRRLHDAAWGEAPASIHENTSHLDRSSLGVRRWARNCPSPKPFQPSGV